jgi:exopolyphosphatase/guanosine-5'-triphosphate,3'-diphosphate pyrophosphatase
MRQGVLYDMLGRFHNKDMRDVTVSQFMKRYHVDVAQARRVGTLALMLNQQLTTNGDEQDEDAPRLITWAANLSEIGISVAYSGYHRHSAYIISNADMPGFSRKEQTRLSQLVLAHRRSLRKILDQLDPETDWRMVLAVRLAVLFYRGRTDTVLPPMHTRVQGRKFRLSLNPEWLQRFPLTVTALHDEIQEWQALGFDLVIKDLPELEAADAITG